MKKLVVGLAVAVLAVAVVSAIFGGAAVENAYGQVPPPCTSPPSGMVSWWPGDGNADDIRDGNDGTLRNGAVYAPGKVGQAFSLDGVNAHVDAGNGANLNIGTGDFTVDFWVRVDDSEWNSILYKYETGPSHDDKHYRIDAIQRFVPDDPMDPSGPGEDIDQIAVTVGDGAEWYINFQWAPIVIGQWHHIAWVLKRDVVNGSSLYVDGDSSKATVFAGTVLTDTNDVDISNDGNLTIGTPEGTPEDSLNGLIDEVEIFNRALTESEVQSIFNAGSSGKCPRAVGGTTDLLTEGLDAPRSAAEGSGSSAPLYAALAGAAVVAFAASGWYVRRRWLS